MQRPVSCDWCGKFIVMVQFDNQPVPPAPYEFFKDNMGRLVKGDDGLFIIEREHKCKAACSNCGKIIILDSGKLYERLMVEGISGGTMDSSLGERRLHRCII
jgi:hypothetical protein